MQFVREWKTAYRNRSTEQRRIKHEIRIAMRESRWKTVGALYSELKAGKRSAMELLLKRAETKLVARESYAALHG